MYDRRSAHHQRPEWSAGTPVGLQYALKSLFCEQIPWLTASLLMFLMLVVSEDHCDANNPDVANDWIAEITLMRSCFHFRWIPLSMRVGCTILWNWIWWGWSAGDGSLNGTVLWPNINEDTSFCACNMISNSSVLVFSVTRRVPTYKLCMDAHSHRAFCLIIQMTNCVTVGRLSLNWNQYQSLNVGNAKPWPTRT